VGYVPQDNNLISELSVMDNLRLYYNDKKSLEIELSEGFLHKLGVDNMCNLKVSSLSGGMKKRVSIGCALAGNPDILILDEPEASLDLPGKGQIREYIAMFVNMGGTVIMSTHDEATLDICDKVYVLSDGVCGERSR
jgi:ABC-type multidrug transport system ATPase subunit